MALSRWIEDDSSRNRARWQEEVFGCLLRLMSMGSTRTGSENADYRVGQAWRESGNFPAVAQLYWDVSHFTMTSSVLQLLNPQTKPG